MTSSAVPSEPPVDRPLQGPHDPEVRAVLHATRDAGIPPVHRMGVADAREFARRGATSHAPGPEQHAVTDEVVQTADASVPVRRYRPSGRTPAPGRIVYVHGGGWVLGGLNESDHLCRHLAHLSGLEVVSVDYRLAPEHPFPAALDDVDSVLAHESADAPPGGIVLVGDSAGGNLVAAVARRARDRGASGVRLQVLVYPAVDPTMATPSYRRHGDDSYLVSALDMRWFWEQYVPDPALRRSPDAGPIQAESLRDLPPALVLVAEYDVLRDEALAYADRLADDGVDVTVDHYDTMIHGFFPMVDRLAAARRAVESVALAAATACGTES